MSETELKPCPFCGQEAYTIVRTLKGSVQDYIQLVVGCRNRECDIKMRREVSSGDAMSKLEVAKNKLYQAWNNRADKEKSLEPEFEGDGYDDNGEIVYDTAYCPICHQYYEVDYDDHDNYCRNCGQKLDWCRVETDGGNE